MSISFYIGMGASIFTAGSTLPQLIKILREKKADDISVLTFVILLGGLGLWIGYGVEKKDWIIVASNSFSLLINVGIIIASLRYKNT